MPSLPFTLPSYRKLTHHPLWNIFLLTVGAAFTAFGVQGITAHVGTLTGGVLGLGLLFWYVTDTFSASIWYLIFNIPLFIFGWLKVSRRFVLYSLYGTLAIFAWSQPMNNLAVPVEDPLYATILAGVMIGTGGGIMLRTFGSGGGLDLLAVFLNERFNLPIGRFSFFFNGALFLFSVTTISLDFIILSFIQVFLSSTVTDYVLRMFNQRKIVLIITNKGQEICNAITEKAGRATLWPAYGGYSHEAREIVMTVTTNFTLRYLEDIVFSLDPQALFAVENSFYVSGAQFPRKSR